MKDKDQQFYDSIKEFYELDKDSIFLVTSKAIIVENENILVLKASVGEKKYTLPGGLVEYNESLEECLHREVLEETNLKVKILDVYNAGDFHRDRKFLFKDGRKCNNHLVEIHYLCEKISGVIKLDWEHEHFKWVNQDNYQEFEYFPTTEDSIFKYFK